MGFHVLLRMTDSESDGDEPKYGLQKYSLVRFVHRGRKRQVESVDIVPSKWLDFNKARARCVTKFMQAPYTEEDLQLIHTLVRNNVDAPEDWPTFSIEQVGRATTYEEALQKIEQLKTEEHALTLDSEDSASEAQRQLTLAVKRQKLQAEALKLKTQFSSPIESVSKSKEVNDTSEKKSKQSKSIREKKHPKEKKAIHNSFLESEQDDALILEKSNGSSVSDQEPSQPNLQNEEKNRSGSHASVSEPRSSGSYQVETNALHGLETHASVSVPRSSKSSTVPATPPSAAFVHLSDFAKDELIDAQIFNFEDIEVKTPFETALIARIDELCSTEATMSLRQEDLIQEVQSLREAQAATTHFLSDKKLIARSTTDFKDKYQLELPLASYDDFLAFEQKLVTDQYFKKDVYMELKGNLDKNCSISKSEVKMLKTFLSKDLAIQFTAHRNSPVNKNKHKFKPTQLCTMMEAVITKARKEKSLSVEDSELNSTLTDVLTNVYKWKP